MSARTRFWPRPMPHLTVKPSSQARRGLDEQRRLLPPSLRGLTSDYKSAGCPSPACWPYSRWHRRAVPARVGVGRRGAWPARRRRSQPAAPSAGGQTAWLPRGPCTNSTLALVEVDRLVALQSSGAARRSSRRLGVAAMLTTRVMRDHHFLDLPRRGVWRRGHQRSTYRSQQIGSQAQLTVVGCRRTGSSPPR